jgi:cytochrome bd ubiquinol oxidase subunit I
MDVLSLARFQFAFTIMFHYIYPILSIGLSLIMVIIEGYYLKTRNPFYLNMAKFWTKIFALTFAIGVATGIVMEFEFGTNWATYSRYVGDVFGSALAAEGVFAFFLESGFLAILLFGWNRVGPKMHFFSTLMVCFGAHFSAIWIVVANSWMQTPAGYHIAGEGMRARAEITDFWTMVFNPSSMDRLTHVVIGAWLAGAFLVISISAYYMLKNRHISFTRESMKIALGVSLAAGIMQGFSGDRSAKIVAQYQPAKFASFEALYKTSSGVPLTLYGSPNSTTQTIDHAISIPNLLSYMTTGDFKGEIKGLDQIPREDWPNVPVLFMTYRIMLGLWAVMLLLSLIAIYKWRKNTLLTSRGFLWILVTSVTFPQIANQVGWVTAEMGRYPWIVYGLLRISDGLSKNVTANQVLSSIIMFLFVYVLLFLLFIYLLNEKIQHGPDDMTIEDSHYHTLQETLKNKEVHHDT